MRITSFTQRLSRRALPKRNLAYFLWRYVANGVRTCRAVTMRLSYSDTPRLARELREQGIAVAHSDWLLTPDGRTALTETATHVVRACGRQDVQSIVDGATSMPDGLKPFLVDLMEYSDGIPADDPLLKVALDPNLLEVVSSYLGLWPCLYSVRAWLNFPTNDPPQVSQLWHRDPEDLQLIKVFTYLGDVGEDTGPFTYIPRTHPFGAEAARSQKLEKKKRLPDERIGKIFPRDSWRVCTGPAGTMILADTIGYHCGGKPLAGRRVLVTFTYTSGTPITDCPMRLAATPAWVSSRLQHAALTLLLQRNGASATFPSTKHKSRKKQRK